MACATSCSRPARSYFRFFLHFFFLAAYAGVLPLPGAVPALPDPGLCLGFLHFLFFAAPGAFGWAGGPGGAVAAHTISVGATEFFRGFGVVTAKSAALLSVSSPGSSDVGQPAAIERRSAIPELSAAAGVPAAASRSWSSASSSR